MSDQTPGSTKKMSPYRQFVNPPRVSALTALPP